jgi:site-specific recombinase XerD
VTDSTSALIVPAGTDIELLGHDAEAAKSYAERSLSDATRAAYRSDIAVFRNWCEVRGVRAVPASPAAVASFAAAQAEQGLKPSTISRRLAAIRMLHRASGVETPTNSEIVTATMRGIRREHGAAPARKTAATSEVVLAMLEHVGDDLKGLRDRAILTFGFATACRRSEEIGSSRGISGTSDNDDSVKLEPMRESDPALDHHVGHRADSVGK